LDLKLYMTIGSVINISLAECLLSFVIHVSITHVQFLACQVEVPSDSVLLERAEVKQNHKYLGAYIPNSMGKSYLSNLLGKRRKKECEEQLRPEALTVIVDELEDQEKANAALHRRHAVHVTEEVARSARKRKRTSKGAPDWSPNNARSSS